MFRSVDREMKNSITLRATHTEIDGTVDWLAREITFLEMGIVYTRTARCIRDMIDPKNHSASTRDLDGIGTVNASTRMRHPGPRGDSSPKGILVGTFVACRVKNCQHLNRLRHDGWKTRLPTRRRWLSAGHRLSSRRGTRISCMTIRRTILRSHPQEDRTRRRCRLMSNLIDHHLDHRPQNCPTRISELVCVAN